MAFSNALTVKLVGSDEDNGVVSFEDFRNFCDNLAKCLRKTDELVSGGQPKIRYRITSLASASASVTLEPITSKNGHDYRGEVIGLFQDTVVGLQEGRHVDPRIGRDTLEIFRELINPLNRRTKEVWVGSARLTKQYEANIENILGNSIPSDGSVSGILERVNVHNRNEFVLYPPIPGYRIICEFPDEMLGQIRQAIKNNVTVWGTLYFQPDTPFPHQVHVSRLEIHPPDNELPKLRDLKGLAPNCTGGLKAVEFVRSLRDAE